MTATSPPASAYLAAPNKMISAANGIDYAYREVGEGDAGARASPALPREPRQLGSRAGRRAGATIGES